MKRQRRQISPDDTGVCAAVASIASTPSENAAPSMVPSLQPSAAPSVSVVPSMVPSFSPSLVPSMVPSFTPSMVPSQMPSDGPLMCDKTTFATLAADTSLTNVTFACPLGNEYKNSGRYLLANNTVCGGDVIFSGENQILDCQGRILTTSFFDPALLTFTGNGPYIVKDCIFSASQTRNGRKGPPIFIVADGSSANATKTIDILLTGVTVEGTGFDASSFISSGTTLCATVSKSTIKSSFTGIRVRTDGPSSTVFLELSAVSTSFNTGAGTNLDSTLGGSIFATITGQTSISDGFGLFTDGSGFELIVDNSFFCNSINGDVILNNATVPTSFSGNTCSKTDGVVCTTQCPVKKDM
jgi:hypothetical protein